VVLRGANGAETIISMPKERVGYALDAGVGFRF